ncbi:unannotated protein [freshwater metagenome]|uniref:Unannotated protein n=1 Tax=freshwater metagenome TaxID=449393 RepID=A0A6J6IT34_9ZZZZ
MLAQVLVEVNLELDFVRCSPGKALSSMEIKPQ